MNKETIIYLFGVDFKTSDQVFSNYKITNLSCTPTFLSMLLMNLKNEYSSVTKITTGGEKMKNSLIGSFKKTFPFAEYINIYASTEAGSLLYSTTEYFSIPEKYISQLKIEDGTLRVHKSLLNEVEKTNNDWYDTNDLVEYVDDKQFKFVSRSNGYLNTGGFRVSPSQVEEKIMWIEGVKDVHVYGKSNSLLGNIICADIIGNNITPKVIKTELIKQSTEKQMIPQVIRIVNFLNTFQMVRKNYDMKNILLTGDSKGLGKNIKRKLLHSSYNVIGLSRNDSDIKYDLSNVDGIRDLYLNIIKERGPIHGYINNAAFAYDDIITNLNSDKLMEMYKVNVFSPMMLTKYVIRDMILNRTYGSIVHISSISAHTGYKGLAMYASTKGSLESYSKKKSREWGKMGIRSNIVCPGFMDTNMSSSLNDEQRNKIFKRNSRQKELTTEEVSSTVKFLISDDSSGITGQIIHVDNGTI